MLGEWATARSELGGELGGAPGLAEELGSGAGLAEDGVGDAAGLGHDIIGNVSVLPVRTMRMGPCAASCPAMLPGRHVPQLGEWWCTWAAACCHDVHQAVR